MLLLAKGKQLLQVYNEDSRGLVGNEVYLTSLTT
jgi:hypothetical protein